MCCVKYNVILSELKEIVWNSYASYGLLNLLYNDNYVIIVDTFNKYEL